tara:strand:+ start:48 stop:722 length:675 start_codon:yes stop_codon:yes gene_type:complete
MFIQNIITNKILNIKFKKAILVGSSGDLLGENKGEFIESFPVIIRMNNAKTIGYEKDVGKRTTIRIVNFNRINSILNPSFAKELSSTVHLILYTNKQEDKFKLLPLLKIFKHLNIHIFTPTAIEHNDNLFQKYTGLNRRGTGTWLSTGWFSLFFMINYIVDKNIIGFGGEKENSLYKYFDNTNVKQKDKYIQSQNSPEGHRFITEKQIFNTWIQEHKLIFHKLA